MGGMVYGFCFLCTTVFQGGFQSFASVALYPTEPLEGPQTVVLVAQLFCVQKNSKNAFNLWCPEFSGSPVMTQDVVSNALSAAVLLEGLML